MKKAKNKSIEGYSLVEIMVVLTVVSIMSGITGYYLTNHSKLYKPDDQAQQIADILQEARQRSLTQRETMRVEIDLTDNIVRLIDENTTTTSADDEIKRQTSLLPVNEVNIEQRASDVSTNPPEPLPVLSAVFKPSIYPPSAPHRVCTLRFKSSGQVFDAGNSATGANDTVTGATLHIWSPDPNDPTKSSIARAITVVGTTGSIRMWEYTKEPNATSKWSDSRRAKY